MKIYTKTGDKGETSLVTGTRVKKYHPRIEAYGTIDELNSYIGWLRGHDIDEDSKKSLVWIQNKLFSIASNLAMDNRKKVKLPTLKESDVTFLENQMDKMSDKLPPLKYFILPGGHVATGLCHVARTVCRRAERLIIQMSEEHDVDEIIIRFINRLSDYLFLLARKISNDLGLQDTVWKPSDDE